jgi:hypothetical protein
MHEAPATGLTRIFAWVKHEAKEVGLITLYFLFCFSVALLLKKLFLADYNIKVSVLSTLIIAALVVAKVVAVLDQTQAGTRFDQTLPLGVVALYKTLVYMVATLVVLFLETAIDVYRETHSLRASVLEIWAHRDWNLFLAKVLCGGLAFAAYHLYAGLDRRLGEGTLRRLVMTRGTDDEAHSGLRPANVVERPDARH